MKRYRAVILLAVVALTFIASHLARQHWLNGEEEVSHGSHGFQRVIALAPSTVEVVYLLGEGERIVGVSEFTRYPEDAAAKPKVGGYLDLDMEALVRLKPEAVILLKAQSDLDKKLQKLGMKTLRVDHMSVAGILESIHEISDFLDVSKRGDAVVAELRKRLELVTQRSAALERKPIVLISIGREGGLGQVKKLVAAGALGYHQELIALAGGTNGYRGKIAFPSLTREHLLRMNPDVIIDLFPKKEFDAVGEQSLLDDWKSLPELKAVRDGRVVIWGEDKHYIPGPRFIETLEQLALEIHRGGDTDE